jgi:GalNAc-alpha-(1->4)-GalNAc-alpha-(1->3)-diNAcBac-PP-undecaprenol alpha-1,4-N-acetyl-D-galactosaminyltransferase
MTSPRLVAFDHDSALERATGLPVGELPRRGRVARVMLVISSLRCGGAEHVMSAIANYWAGRGWQVTLVTLDPTSTDFFPIHPLVERIGMGVSGVSHTSWEAVRNTVTRLGRLRKVIRSARPEVIVSFMPPTTILSLTAGWLERVPVVVSERADPGQYSLPRFWSAMRRLAYPRAGAVVVQTPEVLRWAERFVPQRVVHIIPNFVAVPHPAGTPEADRPPLEKEGLRHVVAMGRFNSQKAFDILIRAFAKSSVGRPEWRLTILGDGEDRKQLELLIKDLGVTSVVRLPGRVANPGIYLSAADLFVLSSRYEGFPNALLEAMAVGLPVIATNCESGPSHIVQHEVDGILVPVENVDALASAMAVLMDDASLRKRLGERATAVSERYAIDSIMSRWESLLNEVIAAHPSAAQR